mgnify:CR=1 FL=1
MDKTAGSRIMETALETTYTAATPLELIAEMRAAARALGSITPTIGMSNSTRRPSMLVECVSAARLRACA